MPGGVERVVSVLARCPGAWWTLDTLAAETGIPEWQLRRILRSLARSGVVAEVSLVAGRGRPKKAYRLARQEQKP